MIYKFSEFLELNYNEVAKFIKEGEELTKNELLEKCTGEISYDVLQSLKELLFTKIGKTPEGELFPI
ncbi:MAG: hypothetical protein ACR2KZ_05145 [Segetibacter sp.]